MGKLSFGNGLVHVHMTWAEFKSVVSAKGMLHQHVEDTEQYRLFCIDGPVVYTSSIYKPGAVVAGIQASNDDDRQEFFDDWEPISNKTLEPRSDEGRLIVAPTYMDTGGADTNFFGSTFTATAGEQTVNDFLVTEQIYLQGGTFWIEDAKIRDEVYFSVVDTDDILGMFSTLGYTVGVDILELKKYIHDMEMHNGFNEGSLVVSSKANILPGLKLRMSYTSKGTEDVSCSVLYQLGVGVS